MLGGEMGGGFRSIPYPLIGQHIKYEPPNRPGTLSKIWCGGWWSEGILEFGFGPNLGLRLEAKLGPS